MEREAGGRRSDAGPGYLMRHLLDMHSLLRALICPEKIPKSTRTIILNANHTLFVSMVSNWEAAIKSLLHLPVAPRTFYTCKPLQVRPIAIIYHRA
jgi:PIN domain nuclease of toxin-antitoxin system